MAAQPTTRWQSVWCYCNSLITGFAQPLLPARLRVKAEECSFNVAVSCLAGDMVASWCTTVFTTVVNPGTLRAKVQMSYGWLLAADKSGPLAAHELDNLYSDNQHHSLDVPLKSAAPYIYGCAARFRHHPGPRDGLHHG